MWEVSSAGSLWHRLRDCEKMYDEVMQPAGDPPRIADSSSINAVSFSSARTTKRFLSSRYATTTCHCSTGRDFRPELRRRTQATAEGTGVPYRKRTSTPTW